MQVATKNGHGKDLARRPFAALTVETWPDALTYCRVERGLDATDITGVKPADVRAFEARESQPSKDDLRALYRALPKLRNYANLLPEELKAAGAQAAQQLDPVRSATFGSALGKALELEGMTHTEFAATVGLSPSTISAYIANGRNTGGKWIKVSMIQATYDRILDLLPILKGAPKPAISERDWKKAPGRKDTMVALARAGRVGGPKREEEEDEAEAAPRALPALPEGKGKAPKPVVAAAPEPPPPPKVKFLVTPATIQRATEDINQAGAAYGVAVATVARLEAELGQARADVETTNRRLMWAIAVLKGEASPEETSEPIS